jgi:hypothetical protein
MIPARPLAEALGARVTWDSAKNAVVVSDGTTKEIDANLISANDLANDYNVFLSVGEMVILKKGNIEISFPRPNTSNKTVTINTDLGILTLQIENGRFYFKKDELKELGLI